MEENISKDPIIGSPPLADTASSKDANCEVINYMAIPSLERMSLMGIVVKLWKEIDRRAFRRWRRHMNFSEKAFFEETVIELREKISLLGLPKIIELKILNLIRPIGEQLWLWRMDIFLKDYDVNTIQNIDILQWTYWGSVDKSKTLALQIEKKRIAHKLYAKACHHCVEHQIYKLWDEMLEYEKEMYSTMVIEDDCCSSFKVYWTCVVRNEFSKFPTLIKDTNYTCISRSESVHETMMVLSILLCNATAVMYFWFKLSEEEKVKNVMKWVEIVFQYFYRIYVRPRISDIVCFLVSHLNAEQQRCVFRQHSKQLLESLIAGWPWQEFLVPTISLMWDFLDINVYVHVVSTVLQFIYHENDFEFESSVVEETLWQLWRATPKAVKKSFFECVAGNVDHLNCIFKGRKFETSWILLSEVLLGQNVEPDTLRDCQFIYKSITRR